MGDISYYLPILNVTTVQVNAILSFMLNFTETIFRHIVTEYLQTSRWCPVR